MKTIITKPNTFYVKKDVVDDVGIIPAYADAYVGMSATYDIKSNPDTSFYLAEANTVSEDDFVYGEGTIKEIYLSVYTNALTQSNPQTSNWLDVFSIKPNIDITEGNMTIASGNFGGQTLFYNSQNGDNTWMMEDFDGRNKAFMDVPLRTKKIVALYQGGLMINYGTLLDIAYETNRRADEDDVTWYDPLTNIGEELGQIANWSAYYLGVAQHATQSYISEGLFGPESRLNTDWSLTKAADGQWVVGPIMGTDYWAESTSYAKRLKDIKKPATWWLEKGAFWEQGVFFANPGGKGDYNVYDETFVARATQDNTIFSDTFESANVRDIKDQSLEGPGDTPTFISYSYMNLVNAESPSDGLCLRMKSFWENYSGSQTGVNAWNTAAPFGRYLRTDNNDNIQAYPQVVHASIYGIPQPTPIDITTSGTGFPAYAPEIEMVFKINRMDVSTYIGSGTGAGEGVGEAVGQHLSMDRSFNIIFNDDAPISADGGSAVNSLYEASKYWTVPFMKGTTEYSMARNMSPWISIVNKSDDDSNATVYTNAAIYQDSRLINKGGSNLYYGETVDNGGILSDASAYRTTIPIGEWVTMRIKLNMFNASSNTGMSYYPNISGGSSLVYFPDLADENGQMKYAVLAHGQPWGENAWAPTGRGGRYIFGLDTYYWSGNAAHYPNMTLWSQNMRSINEIPSGYDKTDINNGYTKVDSPISDDKVVDILVDSISFNNWGPITTNASICTPNGMGQLTAIPAGNFVTPVKYPGGPAPADPYTGAISVYPEGSGSNTVDNYYGKASSPTASYMSFGFASSGTLADNTPHPFLLNNFSVGVEETVTPITMVSGGYFTSGNYLGTFGQNYQNNWFSNLTVGDNTKNLNITGDTNSIDGFVQKGTMTISGAFTGWVKTGNPIIAAKIISLSDSKTSIIVDKPELFDIPLNTPLCVELNNTDYAHKAAGTGSIGYYDVGPNTEPLVQTRTRQGNTIFLSRPIYEDDAQSPGLGVWNFDFNPTRNSSVSTALDLSGFYNQYWWGNYNATKATISPYQYWTNIAMINMSSSAGWGSWFADTIASGNRTLQTRAYDGIVAVSGGSTAGTTFNEILFNDGTYANKWDISFTDPANTIVNLNTDFGYGAINSTNNPDTVPDSDGGLGRMGRDYVVLGQNYFNLSSFVYTTKPEFNTPFNFLLKPTYMNMFDSLYNCNVNTGDATTNPLQVIYGIKDPLPDIDDFEVSPSVDILRYDNPVDIGKATKAQATDLNFQWKESGDDINYRLLFVDTELIENKYHKAICIIPLNETTSTSPPTHYRSVSKYLTNTGVTFSGSNNTPDIEGAQGWALKLDGTDYIGTSGSYAGTAYKNFLRLIPNSGDKFTHIFHLKPSASGTFFSATGNTNLTTGTPLVWQYEISSSKVKMKVGTSGATPTLTSTTSYNLDGIEPLAVVLTFNNNLQNNNFKLYVNGKLEDTLDYTDTINLQSGPGGYFQSIIGANSDGSHKYTGFIEEISFHEVEAYIPQNNNKYTLPTAHLADMSSSTSNKYQARMFLFDYHNIRGTSPTQVCRSNTTSWKWTGVP